MQTIGLTIKAVIQVDEETARRFKRTPRGELTLSGGRLEQFTVGWPGGAAVEPRRLWLQVEHVPDEREDEFLDID